MVSDDNVKIDPISLSFMRNPLSLSKEELDDKINHIHENVNTWRKNGLCLKFYGKSTKDHRDNFGTSDYDEYQPSIRFFTIFTIFCFILTLSLLIDGKISWEGIGSTFVSGIITLILRLERDMDYICLFPNCLDISGTLFLRRKIPWTEISSISCSLRIEQRNITYGRKPHIPADYSTDAFKELTEPDMAFFAHVNSLYHTSLKHKKRERVISWNILIKTKNAKMFKLDKCNLALSEILKLPPDGTKQIPNYKEIHTFFISYILYDYWKRTVQEQPK